MKKIFMSGCLFVLFLMIFSVQGFAAPKKTKVITKIVTTETIIIPAEEAPVAVPAGDLKNATVVTKIDLPALLQRKSYRLGIRAALISPSDSINSVKDMNLDLGFEFDAKLNENLDLGPRIGYVSKRLKTNLSDAQYTAIKFGFGGRMYLTYFGDYGSTHGFFNAYIAGQGDYYIANKGSDTLTTSPASFAGLGATASFGLELAFGPNATGYVDIGYQLTKINSSDGQRLPIDGLVIGAGTRLSFI